MNKTILLVDDSTSIRETVAFFLEEEGYKVIKADNGQNALEKLDGRSISLVLTDLHMPVMNGIELIKNIRGMDNYSKLPIVLLTTETLIEKKKDAKAAGATAWINKPFNKEQLLKVLKKLLR